MAKGNLFLGQGRGKVGDVVFYRMNGWQMARVRNRTPKNPRSNEQLYQRAVIASVMKAYSAGKEIMDHSFQGYTVGEGCMRRFNSVNADILRSELINDVNKALPANSQIGRFCAPKSITCTPIIGLQVSEGTLINNLFNAVENNGVYNWQIAFNDIRSMKTWYDNLKINAGDIYTFVAYIADLDEPIYNPAWSTSNLSKQYQTKFGWIRFIVKDLSTITESVGNINNDKVEFRQMFEIETGGDLIKFSAAQMMEKNKEMNFTFNASNPCGVMACIRSRNDVDLRSTEYTLPIISKDFGISSGYLLTIWQNMVTKVGESDLILEGGEGPSLQPISMDEMDEAPIIPAPVNEAIVRTPARHRGTNNNPR